MIEKKLVRWGVRVGDELYCPVESGNAGSQPLTRRTRHLARHAAKILSDAGIGEAGVCKLEITFKEVPR